MNSDELNIEDIRRRAKDSKASNGQFFLSQAFSSLEGLRGLLTTLSAGILAYFQVTQAVFPNKQSIFSLLFWSLIVGILSYFCGYMSSIYESRYYSDIEKIFARQAFPNKDEYNTMISEENNRRSSKRNYWWNLSFILLVVQTILVLSVLAKI